jgi:hypothetical protein
MMTNNRKHRLKIGNTVYANFERQDGSFDVRHGIVDDIVGNFVAVNWEPETIENCLYYDMQYIHLVDKS